MKLVSYLHEGAPGWGLVAGESAAPPEQARLIPVTGEMAARYPTLRAALAADALAEVAAWAAGREASLPLAQVTFLPPLHDAGKIICIGINYPKRHPVDGVIPPPENIILFLKTHAALVGHGQPLEYPPEGPHESFDYEGELVLVIGKAGRHIPEERALDHIAGYTIMNDGSVRGWQKHSVAAGKNFHASGACGPWMVTADEIGDPRRLQLSTRLNGEEVQRTTVAEMVFDIPAIVNYVSTFARLEPGDIIATGSPEGSGGSRNPQRFLVPGDEVEITWSGVGTLRNRVSAPS
ncbi:MAG: FAA hydrolase family protein [Alphaproteobacteria bacterium]|nr:MAG: FAA hydrolase family protein [Alphaproteobacteria bacterium]